MQSDSGSVKQQLMRRRHHTPLVALEASQELQLAALLAKAPQLLAVAAALHSLSLHSNRSGGRSGSGDISAGQRGIMRRRRSIFVSEYRSPQRLAFM